jgi:hypothetical protein
MGVFVILDLRSKGTDPIAFYLNLSGNNSQMVSICRAETKVMTNKELVFQK